jgi:hypothetical protein
LHLHNRLLHCRDVANNLTRDRQASRDSYSTKFAVVKTAQQNCHSPQF